MIFISHTEHDLPAARAVADLIRASLYISPETVVCTCVHDSARSAKGNAWRQMRDDLSACQVVVALVPMDDIHSDWVAFELGAAWAMDKLIFLLFMPGVDIRDIPEPLSAYPFVGVDDDNAHILLMDTIRDIADFMKLPEKRNNQVVGMLEKTLETLRQKSAPEPGVKLLTPTSPQVAASPRLPVTAPVLSPQSASRSYCEIVYTVNLTNKALQQEKITIKATWDEIFKAIAPHMRNPQSDDYIKKLILWLAEKRDEHFAKNLGHQFFVNPVLTAASYKNLLDHFCRVGYIKPGRTPNTVFTKGEENYWVLTSRGEEHLREIMMLRQSLNKWMNNHNQAGTSVKRGG